MLTVDSGSSNSIIGARDSLHSRGHNIKQEKAFEKINNYRNEIAHEGVERIDLQLMKQLQQNAHEVIRQNASSDAKQT